MLLASEWFLLIAVILLNGFQAPWFWYVAVSALYAFDWCLSILMGVRDIERTLGRALNALLLWIAKRRKSI